MALGDGGFLVLHTPSDLAFLAVAERFLSARVQTLVHGEVPDWIDFQVQVADALEATHAEIWDEVERLGESSQTKIQISCTLILCREGSYQLAHLGAGRPLLFSRRFLHPLTREHTVAFEGFESGKIKAAQLSSHPDSLVQTRGLGLVRQDPMMSTSAAFKRGQVQTGDQILFPTGDLMIFLEEELLLEQLELEGAAGEISRSLTERSHAEGARFPGCMLLRIGEQGRVHPGWFEGPVDLSRPPPPAPAPQEEEEEKEMSPSLSPATTTSLLDEMPEPPPMPPSLQDSSQEKSVTDLLEEAPERPPMPVGLFLPPSDVSASSVSDHPNETLDTSPLEEDQDASPLTTQSSKPDPLREKTTPRVPPSLSQIRHRYPTPEDQRGERWVAIDQESWLDSTISVGLILLGAIAALAGLFWWSIIKA
jgi:hypothetical protein